MQDFFFSADNDDVSDAQADGKRVRQYGHLVILLHKDLYSDSKCGWMQSISNVPEVSVDDGFW
jgi:hypothetical protein